MKQVINYSLYKIILKWLVKNSHSSNGLEKLHVLSVAVLHILPILLCLICRLSCVGLAIPRRRDAERDRPSHPWGQPDPLQSRTKRPFSHCRVRCIPASCFPDPAEIMTLGRSHKGAVELEPRGKLDVQMKPKRKSPVCVANSLRDKPIWHL